MYKEKFRQILSVLSQKNDKDSIQFMFILFPAINGVISAYGSFLLANEFGNLRYNTEVSLDNYLIEKKSALNIAYKSAMDSMKVSNRIAKANGFDFLFTNLDKDRSFVIKNVMIPFVNEFLC